MPKKKEPEYKLMFIAAVLAVGIWYYVKVHVGGGLP